MCEDFCFLPAILSDLFEQTCLFLLLVPLVLKML